MIAATKMNQTLFKSKHLRVDIDKKDCVSQIKDGQKELNQMRNTNDYERSIFIGNLPWVVDEEDLRKHFESVGKIENVRIIRDGQTFIGKGFGYIMFSNKEDMKKSIVEKNGSKFKVFIHSFLIKTIKMFQGRELRVKKAVRAERLEKKQRKKREIKEDRKNKFKNIKMLRD